MVGDEVQLPLGDLDIVAKHAIVAHAEVSNAGCLLFARLDGSEHACTAVLDFAQLVELFVCAVPDHAALAQNEGGLVDNGLFDGLLEVLQRVELVVDFF